MFQVVQAYTIYPAPSIDDDYIGISLSIIFFILKICMLWVNPLIMQFFNKNSYKLIKSSAPSQHLVASL
jgi:hypothetical protein